MTEPAHGEDAGDHDLDIDALASELVATHDPERLMGLVLERASSLLAANAAVLTLDGDGGPLRLARPAALPLEVAAPLADLPAGTDARIVEPAPASGFGSALVLRVPMHPRLGGTIVVLRSGPPRFGAIEVRRGRTFASVAGLALQTAAVLRAQRREVDMRHQTERQLRVRTRQVAQARLGAWEWDVRTDTFVLSGEMARLVGLEADGGRLGRQAFLARVHEEDRASFDAALEAARGGVFGLCHRAVGAGGEVKTLQALGELDVDDAGSPVLRVTVQDVTALKQAQQAVQVVEDRLRQAQKMEAIGRLAGGIAHDFNNLLTAINGHSEALLGQLRERDPLRKGLAAILGAGQRAAALTRQLLAFSRQQVLRPKVVDVNEVLGQLEELLRRLIGETIQLDVVHAPGLWPVRVDPNQLEQVVMNLVLNAADAMPRGGRVTIRTANADLAEELVRRKISGEGGPHVRLTVRDEGCGMSPETRARLFEPFFTTKALGRGTGLGLATVHGIVKQSGGHIYVDSEPGQGTTFDVFLPRATEPTPLRGEPREAEVVQAGPPRLDGVLVVEDDDGVRTLVCDVLRARGHPVVEARGPLEALERCQAADVRLLLTDVVMPGMSGPELVHQARARRPDLRALLMSGHDAEGALRRDPTFSAADVPLLEKPFTAKVLLAAVQRALRAPPSPAPPSRRQRKLVLVVDDVPDNLDYVREALEEAYDVELAGGGSAAFRILGGGARAPDLVILDIAMPRRDGFAVLTDLRGDPATARTPILGFTAYAVAGDRERALAAGFDGFLTKPCRLAELRAVVASLIGPGEPWTDAAGSGGQPPNDGNRG